MSSFWASLTWYTFQKLCITHVPFPYISKNILHSLCSPKEIKYSKIVAHALTCKYLQNKQGISTNLID